MTRRGRRSIVPAMSVEEPAADPSAAAACPWCSAAVPAGVVRCPACGATIQAAEEPQLPGVTAIDPQVVLWSVRSMERRRQNKLFTWLSGDAEPEVTMPPAPGALDPPSPEVRREMLRLALAAELSDLAAEVDAIQADELLEGRGPKPGTDPAGEPPTGPSAP